MMLWTRYKLNFENSFDWVFRSLALASIFVYRCLSPVVQSLSQIFGLGMGCKYPETCSAYAWRQFRQQASLRKALILSIRRLLSCGPWSSFQSKK